MQRGHVCDAEPDVESRCDLIPAATWISSPYRLPRYTSEPDDSDPAQSCEPKRRDTLRSELYSSQPTLWLSRAVHDLLDLLGLHDLSDPPPLPDRPRRHPDPDARKDHRVGFGHNHKLNDLAIGDCARRKVG